MKQFKAILLALGAIAAGCAENDAAVSGAYSEAMDLCRQAPQNQVSHARCGVGIEIAAGLARSYNSGSGINTATVERKLNTLTNTALRQCGQLSGGDDYYADSCALGVTYFRERYVERIRAIAVAPTPSADHQSPSFEYGPRPGQRR